MDRIRFKTKQALGMLGAISIAVFFFPTSSKAATDMPEIFLRSIAISGATTNEDFVEIRNSGKCTVNLDGWKLRKRTASGTESSIKTLDGSQTLLPPDTSFLWANSANDFSKELGADSESTATLASNNALALFDRNDILIDSIAWGAVSKPFQSDGSPTPNPLSGEMLFRNSKETDPEITSLQTPKHNTAKNTESISLCGVSKDTANNSVIVLSEILANPSDDENTNEFIELENRGDNDIDLAGWILRDASKTGQYTFPSGTLLKAGEFLVFYRSAFSFALNNGAETVTLLDGSGNIADTVRWTSTHENISLARDGARWRNTKTLTPGEANIFGNDPEAKTKFPKKGFANIPLEFSTKVKDSDGDTTKVTWNFGDGHKSYKAKTTHAYEKTGKYTVTLTVTDGVADVMKTFTIKIEKYHAPKIRIVSLTPNPAGRDTDEKTGEWILIQNKSKKKVDLKGWSIATGATKKKLVNHPLRESFEIPAGKTKRLIRGTSLFSLNNKETIVELRDPRGKAAQTIHYKYTLAKTAPDDAQYSKETGIWTWIVPTEQKETQAFDEASKSTLPAPPDEEPIVQGASITDPSKTLAMFYTSRATPFDTVSTTNQLPSLDATNHFRFTQPETLEKDSQFSFSQTIAHTFNSLLNRIRAALIP